MLRARARGRGPRTCWRICAPSTGTRRVRIARLDLTRYGRFSGQSLDFGGGRAGAPDFHVVYGLNETGQVDTAAAILDLLFGIEKHSAYGAAKGRASVPNWHAYATMRIGARLELGGGAHEVARLKRDKQQPRRRRRPAARREPSDPRLGGVDRETFHMMFSLDDETPGEGRRGDPREPRRPRAIVVLSQRRACRNWRPARSAAQKRRTRSTARRSSTGLARMKRELDALKDEREEADTLASAYAELVRQRDAAGDA